MSKRKSAQTESVANDAPDEYTGIGGTYIRDPKTGKRSPLVEPESEPPASAPLKKTEPSEE